jgi:hypothetical protein
MKIKVELDKGETEEQADEFLEKALKAKKKDPKPERYTDQVFEDLVSGVDAQHQTLIQDLVQEIKDEVRNNVL